MSGCVTEKPLVQNLLRGGGSNLTSADMVPYLDDKSIKATVPSDENHCHICRAETSSGNPSILRVKLDFVRHSFREAEDIAAAAGGRLS